MSLLTPFYFTSEILELLFLHFFLKNKLSMILNCDWVLMWWRMGRLLLRSRSGCSHVHKWTTFPMIPGVFADRTALISYCLCLSASTAGLLLPLLLCGCCNDNTRPSKGKWQLRCEIISIKINCLWICFNCIQVHSFTKIYNIGSMLSNSFAF